MAGTTIDINDSGFKGYFAPPPSGKGPGIVLIQEAFGVNPHIRDTADLYALAGFTVLAPDLYWRIKPGIELGYTPEDIKQGIEYANKLDENQTVEDLKATITKLRSMPECKRKIGSVGFCMGGSYSYLLATRDAVDVAICYYGGKIAKHVDEASHIHCPIMMHFGEKDKNIPMSDVEKIKEALKNKGHVEIYTYDAGHGFNCDARGSYDRKSSMLAYGRTQILLNKTTT